MVINRGLWYELLGNYYFPCLTVPAEATLSRLIEQTAKQEGITEQYKAKKQMDWVRKKVRNARGFSYRRICGHLLAKTWVDAFAL